MATASRVTVSVKADGSAVNIPANDVARLMYYLRSVTVGTGLDVLSPYLVDFQNYQRLTAGGCELVFKYAYELSPDLFIDKVIFLDNNHEVIPRGYTNEFCTVSAAVSLVTIQQNFMLAGKAQNASRVMFYNTTWLETYYWEPFRRNKSRIARVALGSLHCFHCKGGNGECLCSNGCPRSKAAQCREFDPTAGVELITSFFEALSTISSNTPPPIQDSKTHNATCDGCKLEHISGERFKCRVCDDYDLCETCYSSKVHNLSHDFYVIKSPGAEPKALLKRSQHTATCDGCTQKYFEGTRYRCRSCDDYDFCQQCYSHKPHNPFHQFNAIEYPGASPIPLPKRTWLSSPTPASIPASTQASIPTPSTSISQTPSLSNRSDTTEAPPPYDATPFFYHDLSVSELKKYLEERDVAYNDILDRESLSRRVWDTHVDCMSIPELNTFLQEHNISTADCRDINSRRQKAKDTFQASRPTAVQVNTTPTNCPVELNDEVLLSGLKKVEMNGKTGKVVAIDLAAGRAEVYLEEFGKSFKVKFENVVAVEASEGSELLD